MVNALAPRFQSPPVQNGRAAGLLADMLEKAARDPTTWRWWADVILDAQSQSGRAPMAVDRERESDGLSSTIPSGKPKSVLA
jgi:hypothetical protein